MSATANTKVPAKHRAKINRALDALCKNYFDSIPVKEIQAILETYELKMEDGIYCGREGESNEPIGNGCWLRMTWYKLQSNRFEIVAYVS